MAALDELAPNYRRAQQYWPDAPSLGAHYEALATNFSGNGFGLVEHVKSFVESVCLTIMTEHRVPMPSSDPSTTELLGAALRSLGLQNSRGATKLDLVLSGFNKLSDGLTAVRNELGAIAHGKDGFLDAITVDHARAFLHTGDAIIGVLLNALDGKQPDMIATRQPYESFPHLNERIDRAVGVGVRIDEDADRPIVVLSVTTGRSADAIELRVEPSRFLFGIDREAYVEVLKTAEPAASEEEVAEDANGGCGYDEVVGAPLPDAILAERPVMHLVAAYTGALSAFLGEAKAFLHTEGIDTAVPSEGGVLLVESLLATAEMNTALDWKKRETAQSRLRIACKRVLIRFGCKSDKAGDVAGRFVAWLRVKTPDAKPSLPDATEPGRSILE